MNELFVVVTTAAAAAFFFFVFIFESASEFSAASRAGNVIEIDAVVKADGIAASRAFHFCAVAAVTVIVVAIAAIAIVVVKLIEVFFESAEIFVHFFNVVFEIFGVFLETVYRIRDICKNVEDRIYNFIVNIKTFSKTFDVCNFFGNVHRSLHTL